MNHDHLTTPEPGDTPDEWMPTELRNADLAALRDALTDSATRRRDLVVPASRLVMTDDGDVMVPERDHLLTDDGVTEVVREHFLSPLDAAHADLCERYSIGMRYYRKMQDGHVPLLAQNVNEWMQVDSRTVTLRTYDRGEHTPGLLRAVLSDRYAVIDNFDVLLAGLSGLAEAGVDPGAIQLVGDLTERRMRVRIVAPSVALAIPDLLGDYRSPFTGESATDLPLMFAGLEVANSETGSGAFTLTPRVELQVCRNGMTMRQDVTRAVHLGGKMDEGIVRWSDDTQRRNLELVTARTRDAVSAFLSMDYLNTVANRMREAANVEVTETAEVIARTSMALSMSDVEADALLGAFIKGGQTTALAVGHAVTAIAQDAEDPERAAELEASFFDVVAAAAAV